MKMSCGYVTLIRLIQKRIQRRDDRKEKGRKIKLPPRILAEHHCGFKQCLHAYIGTVLQKTLRIISPALLLHSYLMILKKKCWILTYELALFYC
jgi:hypothetical protein